MAKTNFVMKTLTCIFLGIGFTVEVFSLHREPKQGYLSYSDSSQTLNQKRSQMKALSGLNSVLLTFRCVFPGIISEKILALLLYWPVEQQQTTAFRIQNIPCLT